MNTSINTPPLNTELENGTVPESLVDDVNNHIIFWSLDAYYAPAMQDYFMARLARFNGMSRTYAWLSSQCIERLVKFNCLCYGLPLSKDGFYRPKTKHKNPTHDYISLFSNLGSKTDCLSWNLYTKIPSEDIEFELHVTDFKNQDGTLLSIDFSNCTPLELVTYFNTVGDTRNRYGNKGISTGYIDILLFDALVAKLRSVCIAGDISRDFRFAMPQGVSLFNRYNFQFQLPESIYDSSDGYSASVSETTYPELLAQHSNFGSFYYANQWLRYRLAI